MRMGLNVALKGARARIQYAYCIQIFAYTRLHMSSIHMCTQTRVQIAATRIYVYDRICRSSINIYANMYTHTHMHVYLVPREKGSHASNEERRFWERLWQKADAKPGIPEGR